MLIRFEEPKRRIAAYDGDKLVGKCEFMPRHTREEVWIATHTEVDREYEGQGIAARMAEMLVEEARNHEVKIRPECSYIVRFLESDPKYADVTAEYVVPGAGKGQY
ncbi:MAG: N-acetyltransferase [Clostridia bacterium]|nr:N-acetyltransferase [Clostridia bacterium]